MAAGLAAFAQLPVAGGRGARGACRRSCGSTTSPAPLTPRKQIAGLAGLTSRRHFARVVSEDGVAFARGTQVEMEFDEEQFVGGGVYLFAAVLECFLGLYVSMNSFSQLRVRVPARERRFCRQWPPRAGQKILLYRHDVIWSDGRSSETLDREPYLLRVLPGGPAARAHAARAPGARALHQSGRRSGALRGQPVGGVSAPARSRRSSGRRTAPRPCASTSWG